MLELCTELVVAALQSGDGNVVVFQLGWKEIITMKSQVLQRNRVHIRCLLCNAPQCCV